MLHSRVAHVTQLGRERLTVGLGMFDSSYGHELTVGLGTLYSRAGQVA